MPRFFKFALLVATLLATEDASILLERSGYGARLAHFCVDRPSQKEKREPVIMLHGLTDIKETWDGIFQNIPLLTQRRVCIYDARNHGDSPWNDTFNVDVLSEDLGSFMSAKKIKKAILVGHSMGGLTVMKFALQNPSKVHGLFIEDINPSISNDVAVSILGYLKLLQGSLSSIPDDADENTARKAVTDYFLKATNTTPPAHLFKKFPFRCRDGVWKWKFNIRAFIKSFEDADAFLGKMEGRYDGKVFFIYGTASFIKVGDHKEDNRKLFPNSRFVAVKGAGHDIHSDHPEFLKELIKFLK